MSYWNQSHHPSLSTGLTANDEPCKVSSVTRSTDLNYTLIVKELELMHSSLGDTGQFGPDVAKTELNATRQAQQMSKVLSKVTDDEKNW